MKETQIILNRLLDRFENSKHLSEPHTSKRRVMLRVDKKELPEYDFEDAAVRDAYNAAAQALERQSLIQLEWDRKSVVFSAVILNLEQVPACYALAGRLHPRERAERLAARVSRELAAVSVPWIADWREEVCTAAREQLKIPPFCKDNDRALPDLLCAFRQYAELTDSITMRAFSSRCFHDTKYFERHVRETFLRIARKYCTDLAAACQETELGERDQLALLGIYARPELYELSGACLIRTQRGSLDVRAAEPYGVALPSTLVDAVTEIEPAGICRVTFIENKTNYDEYLLSEKQPDELVVYHGGFLSPQKKKLFAVLSDALSGTEEVRFWADIDRGGFRMFDHLQGIFPPLKPMRMDGRVVEQYHESGLSRPEKYLDQLAAELHAGQYPLFTEAIQAILQYGVTVEQEALLHDRRTA